MGHSRGALSAGRSGAGLPIGTRYNTIGEARAAGMDTAQGDDLVEQLNQVLPDWSQEELGLSPLTNVYTPGITQWAVKNGVLYKLSVKTSGENKGVTIWQRFTKSGLESYLKSAAEQDPELRANLYGRLNTLEYVWKKFQ